VVADFRGRIWLDTEDLLAPNDLDHEPGCAQGVGLEWIDNDRLGVTCERGPSVADYGVLSISAGGPIKSYIGLDFVWSPDRKQLAHLGLLEHFSPPFEENECLLIGDRTVSYPRCTRGSPRPDKAGKVFRNIHLIDQKSVSWSPDSTQVAYIDRVSDWRMDPNAWPIRRCSFRRATCRSLSRKCVVLAEAAGTGEAPRPPPGGDFPPVGHAKIRLCSTRPPPR
jgi:hypothetical protein